MKISTRLMLGAITLTVVAIIGSAGTTGLMALRQAGQAVQTTLTHQFQAIAQGRKSALQSSIAGDRDLLQSLAAGRMTQQALYRFVRPFGSYRYEVGISDMDALQSGLKQWYHKAYAPVHRRATGQRPPVDQWLETMAYEAKLLQHFYLQTNPGWPDKLSTMTDRSDATIYGQQHRKYHDSFRDIVERFGFSDLMLIDRSGQRIVYSVSKGPHLGTSLKSGPFRDTALADLTRTLADKPGRFAISRFSHSPFSRGRLNVYMGVAVYHKAHSPDQPTGYLVAQMPAGQLSRIVSNNRQWRELGLGETGDVYLTGPGARLITRPRGDATPRPQRLDSAAVRAALAGESGVGRQIDYRGRKVFAAWEPVMLGDKRYALVVQQAPEEVFAQLRGLKTRVGLNIAIAAVVLIALAAVGAFFYARYLGRPLARLSGQIERAASERDLTAHFDSRRSDEVGDISRSLNALFSALRSTLGEILSASDEWAETSQNNARTSAHCRSEAQQQRREMHGVDQALNGLEDALEQVSRELTAVTGEMGEATDAARAGQRQVSDVAGQVSELQSRIRHSDESMQALTSAADDIAGVVDTIAGVAEQTNLLALNAAIEAARAGEHGRGFAVVADEVRRLSASTHEATGEIQQLIDRLRSTVHSTAEGLAAEQASASNCAERSAEAEASLTQIQSAVEQVNRVIARISDRSGEEHQRARSMRDTLARVLDTVEQTDHAIAELATSADSQSRLARQTRETARQVKI